MSYVARKIGSLLKRLLLDMQARCDSAGERLIRECSYLVIEETGYDNLDGGMTGHDVVLFAPEEVLGQIPIKDLQQRARELDSALGSLIPRAEREFIHDVRLELADENDAEFQKATPYGGQPVVNPDTLPYWKPGEIRLFISHRDAHKAGANELATALSAYGISSFVAHDTIQPMAEWQHEILKALATMEIMLLYLTEDFAESAWCEQEVGYAFGRTIPVVSLKLGRCDPPGFAGARQGLRGDINHPAASVPALYKLIGEKLGVKERLQDGLVAAFAVSPDFDQARYRFDRMNRHVDHLTEGQLATIVQAYATNDQLYRAIYLNNKYNRLTGFLDRATGQRFVIEGGELRAVKRPAYEFDAEVPF
jgi:hypothetical protein